MGTDSRPATPDPRVGALTTAIIRAWLPWDALGVLALVGVFVLPERWTSICILAIAALATVALLLGIRRVESSGLDRELTTPARRLVWALAAGMYLFAVVSTVIWWSSAS